jgi:hypothetical protein
VRCLSSMSKPCRSQRGSFLTRQVVPSIVRLERLDDAGAGIRGANTRSSSNETIVEKIGINEGADAEANR